jgi:hypothetical protein
MPLRIPFRNTGNKESDRNMVAIEQAFADLERLLKNHIEG